MSVDNESSIQKVDSYDSIVACQQSAADFFDSIGQRLHSRRRCSTSGVLHIAADLLQCPSRQTRARNRHSTAFRAAKAQASRRSVGKELLICSPGTQLLTNRKRGIVCYFSGGTFGTFEYGRHDLLCGGQPFAIQRIIASLPPATLNHVAVVSCVFFCKATDGDSGLLGGPMEFGRQNIFFFDLVIAIQKEQVRHVRTAPAPLEAPSK